MHLDKYAFEVYADKSYAFEANDDLASYVFESHDPKGIIKKVVNYTEVGFWNGLKVYNLAFGDWDESSDRIDDSTVSNNGDRDKILATVASTALAFLARNGEMAVVAQGATPVRTRLYQMGVNAHLADIEKHFKVYGIKDKEPPAPFQSGVNYQAILVVKKKK
ncbi:MAG: hypothetical protein J7578_01185 [Chitinophagaceae bacterium]|nr:hypothetical protein [Chitinophagaceae bacterium]